MATSSANVGPEIAAIRGSNAAPTTSPMTSDMRISDPVSIPFVAVTSFISGRMCGSICSQTWLQTCDGIALMTISAPLRTSSTDELTWTEDGISTPSR